MKAYCSIAPAPVRWEGRNSKGTLLAVAHSYTSLALRLKQRGYLPINLLTPDGEMELLQCKPIVLCVKAAGNNR